MYIFTVHGAPVPQKQTGIAMIGGKARTWNPSRRDIERIRWQIKPFAPPEPLTGPIELTIAFFLPIPKATSRCRRLAMVNRVILPITRPDADNLAYLVTNALKEIVYKDDSQICVSHVYKFYGSDPKTVIKVRPILQLDPVGYHEGVI